MQDEHPVKIVQAWLDAVNQRDSTRLAVLSDAQIEIIGPRGSAYGTDVLHAWLERAGATLTTHQTFARNNMVVVAQHGIWQSQATGGVPSEANVASMFRVRSGRIVQYARYDTLTEALTKAELTETDELEQA